MADYETLDISSELSIIANEPKGAEVKDAIWRALDKLNKAKSGPAPGPSPDPPIPGQIGEAEVIYRLTSFYDGVPGIGSVVRNVPFMPYSGWTWWQETNDDAKTTATVTATVTPAPTAPCLLVVAAMHRDTVSIEGDGWTKVVDSQSAIGTDINQQITVWKKHVSAGEYTITVNQNSSVRMSVKSIMLYNASDITLIDNTVLASVPHTPAAKTGKRRLYLLSSVYASSNYSITASYSGIDLKSANELRFSAFYDYEPDVSAVPSFSYSSSNYTANSINALVFDIEEV